MEADQLRWWRKRTRTLPRGALGLSSAGEPQDFFRRPTVGASLARVYFIVCIVLSGLILVLVERLRQSVVVLVYSVIADRVGSMRFKAHVCAK